MKITHRVRRSLAVGAAGAMVLSLLPASASFAGVEEICEDAPEADFDDADSIAEAQELNVNCLAAYGITQGDTSNNFNPGAGTTRQNMALFVARTLSQAEDGDLTIPEDTDDEFSDISNINPPEARHAINWLESRGLVTGYSDGTFRPGVIVPRDQMATFIFRLLEELGVEFDESPENAFEDDDASFHEDSINALASENVIGGFPDGTFRPAIPVSRQQMAGFVIGGAGAVDDAGNWNGQFVEGEEPTPATFTVRPELTGATILATTTAGQATPSNPAGTTVRYTFDENIATFGANAPVAGNFHAYESDNDRLTANAVVSAEGNQVVVRFDSANTAALAEQLTLATVALGAVRDADQNLQNPQGAAAIGTSASTPTGQAGVTAAPDLVNVSGFRPAATLGLTAVDFTFDEAAFVQNNTGFDLVLVDATEEDCTFANALTNSGGTHPGGNGTTTITVVCDNPGGNPGVTAGTALTASNVARGTVLTGTVGDATGGGNVNPLQAFAVSPNATSSAPDLLSASFQLDSTATVGGADVDAVIYNFDQAVGDPAAVPTQYRAYLADGTEVTGVTAARNPSNQSQVRVEFANNALTNAVGVNVTDAANTGGQQDEVGVANPSQTTRTSGQTSGPQLVSVTLDQGTDQFGNPGSYRATYTFDEAIGANNVNTNVGVNSGNFFLVQADGTLLTAVAGDCTRVGATATTGATQVRCDDYTGHNAANQTLSQAIGSSVLGTVAFNAVTDQQAQPNPEGAAGTTGGTGTPAN